MQRGHPTKPTANRPAPFVPQITRSTRTGLPKPRPTPPETKTLWSPPGQPPPVQETWREVPVIDQDYGQEVAARKAKRKSPKAAL